MGSDTHNSAERLEGVQAGAIYGGVHYNQVPQQAGGPRRYGVVPSRVDCFQERAVAEELAATVAAGAAAVLTGSAGGTSVLAGLGGVGKTQLAANYAESVAGDVDLLVWITATSRQAILAEYATIIADLTGYQSPDPEAPAKRFLAYLATMTGRWLVVLDDVQSPADLRDLWPPTTSVGQVVVTTRRRDSVMRGKNRRVVDVDTFSPVESLAFLEFKLADHPHLLAEAEYLANDLGHLPLALAQAAAYVLDRDITCAEYRERLADQGNSLESLAPEQDCLPEDHREPVARTWSLSVQLANDLNPAGLAKPLLELASMLDPNGIPGDVFVSEAVREYLAKVVEHPVTAAGARDALGCLHRLSLINHDARKPHRAVRVHALVQRTTRDSLFDAQLKSLAQCAADSLAEMWPEIETDTTQSQVLRANTMALHAIAEPHLWESEGHVVLFQAGDSLGEWGRATEAVAYFEQLRTAVERQLGSDHPDTLSVRHSIAIWRDEAGDPITAIAELQAVLADRTRILGSDHIETLTTHHNLANFRGEAGDPATATSELQALLVDVLRVLGPDHRETLTTRHNLAIWHCRAGDPITAIAELQAVLTDRTRILGSDHIETLTTHHNLANFRGEAGDPATATSELQALLVDVLRVLGPDHPNTLVTRHNLADWRGQAGDPTTAITEYEAVLADRTRVLGPDHPDTLITRHNLTNWRKRVEGR
ncbi:MULTISPECIES: tetratricopeptide repeat protein [unclassified Crossiella]|uniref:tetratricopeptide repeat protein n=1 Tax=unclassified Crossiella TaxID=2620835 RepID=UPI001FFE96C6|nr:MULTISPECIES: tetratricopeptide repeat protein [unclassified Crossiella]MCK2240576.1 tetratricopeptide repeat protein [Crossiella sp. S99.2]MCK2252973.1 tetratricopeptide repeat protein [Crossiella sp. S99.1]